MTNYELKEIFDNIILPEATRLLDTNPGLFLVKNAFELLLEEYNVLYEFYSKKYMHPNSEGLDVHKELSTIVISLLRLRILKTVDSSYYESSSQKYAFNETLAFQVGCGILKAAIVYDFENDSELDDEERKFCCAEIERKLLLPKTSYQSYYLNVITEFYYTSREGSYNVLGLADKFFWIERFNKRKIKEKCKQVIANKSEKQT